MRIYVCEVVFCDILYIQFVNECPSHRTFSMLPAFFVRVVKLDCFPNLVFHSKSAFINIWCFHLKTYIHGSAEFRFSEVLINNLQNLGGLLYPYSTVQYFYVKLSRVNCYKLSKYLHGIAHLRALT
jgi:hypothetical protein